MNPEPDQVLNWLRALAEIIVFRMLPFSVFLVLDNGRAAPMRAVAVLLPTSLAVACAAMRPYYLPDLANCLLGMVYFVFLCVWVHASAPVARLQRLGRIVIFCVLFILFVYLPGLLFTASQTARVVLVVVGFELSLSAYSYFQDRRFGRTDGASLGALLFFLMVNPELVYPGRGSRCAPRLGRGTAQAGFGASIMFVGVVLSAANAGWLSSSVDPSVWRVFVSGGVAVATLYAMHAGLAHLQIGLCGVVGYAAPARYHYPFAAADPPEFWRRWNTYMGRWMRSYVYAPLVRAAARRRLPSNLSAMFATTGVFGFLGVTHDLVPWLLNGRTPWLGLSAFLVWGAQLIGWQFLARRGAVPSPAVCRLAVAASIALSAWWFVPAA